MVEVKLMRKTASTYVTSLGSLSKKNMKEIIQEINMHK